MQLEASEKHPSSDQFRLPADARGTDSLLARIPSNTGSPVLIYYGCPDWDRQNWVGKIYPAGTRVNEYLEAYATQFNSIELSATYHKLPDPTTLVKWRSMVGPDFRFCPTFPRKISHGKQLDDCRSETLEFINRMHGLGENLGDFFLQLPPAFGPSRYDVLLKFLDDLPGRLPMHLDLKHPGWYSDQVVFDRVCSELEDRGVGLVITDSPERRDAVHMRLTCSMPMVRFTASDLNDSVGQRLDFWAERINLWLASGLKTLWFFFHLSDNSVSPETADLFLEKLSEHTGLQLPRIQFEPEPSDPSGNAQSIELPSQSDSAKDFEGDQMKLF